MSLVKERTHSKSTPTNAKSIHQTRKQTVMKTHTHIHKQSRRTDNTHVCSESHTQAKRQRELLITLVCVVPMTTKFIKQAHKRKQAHRHANPTTTKQHSCMSCQRMTQKQTHTTHQAIPNMYMYIQPSSAANNTQKHSKPKLLARVALLICVSLCCAQLCFP